MQFSPNILHFNDELQKKKRNVRQHFRPNFQPTLNGIKVKHFPFLRTKPVNVYTFVIPNIYKYIGTHDLNFV